MIDTQALRKKILDAAIRGKLTEQLPEDGNAEDLYKEIQAEKQRLIKEGKKKEKPLPKIAKKEIPFSIPENWKWVRLTDILVQQPSNGFSPKNVSNKTDYKKLTLTATTSGKFKEVWNYVDISAGQAEKYFLKKDDLLIQRSNSREFVGTVCIYTGCDDAFIFPDLMMRMRCIDNVDLQYIFTALRAPTAKAYFSDKASGTSGSMPKINQEIVKMTAVPLPPISEQKRIVAKLNSIFAQLDLIDEQQKKISDNAQSLRNKLIELGISGELTERLPEDGNAEDLYEEIQDEKQKLIKEGKIKKEKPLPEIAEDEIPFDIPKNWKWVRWGNLSFSIQYGYNAPAMQKGRIRMVRISDIQNNVVAWGTVPFCEIKEDEIATYLLRENDILFARTGTVGKSFLVKEVPFESIYAGYLIRTRYSSNLIPLYMKLFMESQLYWNQLRDGTTATAQPNCNGQKLSKMLIPLPPLAEQKRIVEKLDQLLPLCDAMRADISGGVGA